MNKQINKLIVNKEYKCLNAGDILTFDPIKGAYVFEINECHTHITYILGVKRANDLINHGVLNILLDENIHNNVSNYKLIDEIKRLYVDYSDRYDKLSNDTVEVSLKSHEEATVLGNMIKLLNHLLKF